jgi:hypothetical protein
MKRRLKMFKTKSSLPLFIVLFLCLPSVNSCWYPGQQFVRGGLAQAYLRYESQKRKQLKGHVFDIGRIETVGLNTPVSLKEKVVFELMKKLRQKGLIAGANDLEKRLLLNIEISATVPPFGSGGAYDEIQSHVVITDINRTEIVAETTLRTLNAFGWTNEFTEITHAGQITSYLEGRVR